MKLARRLQAIKPSATLALNARAKALAASGKDVVVLAAGEPDFDTPEFVKQAAIDALRTGFTKYTATAGMPELREAVCRKLEKDNGLKYAVDQVVVTAGGKQSLYNCFQALLDEGDEVIIFAPYWVSYPDMVHLAGGTPVIVPTREEDGYAPDPAAIKKALTPRTRAIVLNSPANPTGAVYSRATLEGIADAVRGHDCIIVTDDMYEKLLYTGEPFLNLGNVAPDLVPRLLLSNGLSKSHAMTGWRLGYAAGPKALITGMQLVQDQSTSNASSITQKAALAALNGPTDTITAMVNEYRERRDLFVAGLNAIPGIRCRLPEGAFYAMADVRGLLGKTYKGKPLTDSLQLSEALLNDFLVAAVPGDPFGAPGYIRMSFVTSREVLQKGLTRLRDFVAALG
ncbi:pyridoxal phosphate-dependent aminotransferase [Corallococcus exiguus]|uniref:pyridoxal phosphate-dependent aminotransferase n=1 Tax=Corallococcus TaxID=83461 RepID=UPI000EA252F1|nr:MULTISPECIES: pyridoxal phosphate-dependent aminotransferase [Corallococcus]RKI33570.1 pyridoxal phosphate-dependent aminotransferase [Corallococcus sp. AB004]NNB98316.1 pyridoxal phosphate-dependent aminotransferase [Corallococcus exiguus]NNC07113.1 pyridoxal phosphate-dependent aminotransferase [Corallococcus exiguus]NPC52261.1 pyridoxal phosphate-dependent aminotransferase [Corallococcus exiguus]RKH19458.1 pyridoxal phosphate-dependent aminotransferase [Corallococcus sp. CA041A]